MLYSQTEFDINTIISKIIMYYLFDRGRKYILCFFSSLSLYFINDYSLILLQEFYQSDFTLMIIYIKK